MLTFSLTAGLLVLGIPGEPESVRYVMNDDVRAEYTRSVDAGGNVHLVGYDHVTRGSFRFRVRPNGWVEGDVGGRLVRFRMSARKRP